MSLNSFTNLLELDCSNNQLVSLDLQNLISLRSLDCSFNPLTSLDVQSLIDLEQLFCSYNQLTTLNVQGLTNLRSLFCNDNELTSLNVQGLVNLEYLYCEDNSLELLNLQGLTNLISVFCWSNELSTLNIDSLINLESLYCSDNQLSTLNIDSLINLEILDCSHNQLSTLNTTSLINLENLNCSYNQFATLNVQNLVNLKGLECRDNQLSFLELRNSTNLENLSCHNNQLTNLYIKNGTTESISIDGNPNLLYICADDFQIEIVQSIVDDLDYANCIINSYCSSILGDDYNTIQGETIFDGNNNGCDSSDTNIPIKVHITNATESGYAFSNGDYTFYTEVGTYTLTPIFENPYFFISPESTEIIFENNFNNIVIQDFCITPNGEFNDLEITILPLDDARPGFDASYELIYENKGTTTLSGDIVLNYMDDVLDFVSSSEMTSDQTTGALTWNYNDLVPFESGNIAITFNVNSPVETPPVEIDDVLTFTANIQSNATEETPDDNIGILNQTVVGSYDPNDKTCLEGTSILPEKVGDYLHYIIRFENTGTYAAENVVVRDVIDVTKFDIASLEVTNSSHEMRTRIEGNVVEFIFEGINLPFEDDFNDGYLAFKIKTLSSLVLDDEVSNQANIFFDFNAPITTNEAITQVSTPTSNQDIKNNLSIDILPNPVHEILYFNTDLNMEKIGIFDALGQFVQYENIKQQELNVSHLSDGIYFIKVFTEEGIATLKIIKE